MVSVLCAQESAADCNDQLVCNERRTTKTLLCVSIFMMTVVCYLGLTLCEGNHESPSSHHLDL
jgi:hypothetical protein